MTLLKKMLLVKAKLSPAKKNCVICLIERKMLDEKCLLFRVKSSFRSQDI